MIADFFQKVFLINLKRRKDRLANFRRLQRENGWELPEVEVFSAIEGDKIGVPDYYISGGGAYGCLRSWVTILERSIMDELDTILVLEDDVVWRDDAWEKSEKFLSIVPKNFELLMLGGQDIRPPVAVIPGVWKCQNSQRTHAIAVRGEAKRSLLKLWTTCNTHIDHVLGGTYQSKHVCYKPDEYIFGQSGVKSDISGRTDEPKFWVQPNNPNLIYLQAPREVVDELRAYGFHCGFNRDPATGLDKGLIDVAKLPNPEFALRKWIDVITWESASQEGTVATLWHPDISLELVSKVYSNVTIVKGKTVQQCLKHCKNMKLKKNNYTTHLLVLRASRFVAEN